MQDDEVSLKMAARECYVHNFSLPKSLVPSPEFQAVSIKNKLVSCPEKREEWVGSKSGVESDSLGREKKGKSESSSV